MTLFYAFGVILILVLAGVYLHRLKRRASNARMEENKSQIASSEAAMTFDDIPDVPIPFGYKNQWFAVKTSDSQAVIKDLNLVNVRVSNWRTGLLGAYAGYYFISPPVQGWTLVISLEMPDLNQSEDPGPLTAILKLSATFGEACYFGTHRVVEYHAWAKAVNGNVVRAYGYLGEAGEELINEGKLSREEMEHHLIFTGTDVEVPSLPTEEDVLLMAKLWTIDPQMEDVYAEPATGFIGTPQ